MKNFKEFVLKSKPRLKEVWFMSLYSYNTLSNEAEAYANQRVIEELENKSAIEHLEYAISKLGDKIVYQSVITGIIKQLKQD